MSNESKVKDGVTKVVQEIYNKEGAVQPSRLVEKARPKSSPAHAGFTWDEPKAAYMYNLIEARSWIRTVHIVPAAKAPAERMVHIPATERIDDSKEGTYKPISIVCEQVDEFERARQEVVTKINSLLYSLRELDRAADGKGDPDTVAILSQLRRGIELVEKAVLTMH